MPLKVECHTVPHFKALTRGIEHLSAHGQASIFRWQKISLKNTHFTSQTDQTAVSFDLICTSKVAQYWFKDFILCGSFWWEMVKIIKCE